MAYRFNSMLCSWLKQNEETWSYKYGFIFMPYNNVCGGNGIIRYEYIFIHGHSLGFAALFVILLLLVALTNLVIAFRTLRILSKLDDDVEVEGW